MKIRDVELYSGNELITEQTEKNIAFFLCRFGRWPEQEPSPLMNGDMLEGIEYHWKPEEETQGQGFEGIGSLSSMFSTLYRENAWDDEGNLVRLRVDVSPGFLGALIPEGYKGKVLPLWVFVQTPNFDFGVD